MSTYPSKSPRNTSDPSRVSIRYINSRKNHVQIELVVTSDRSIHIETAPSIVMFLKIRWRWFLIFGRIRRRCTVLISSGWHEDGADRYSAFVLDDRRGHESGTFDEMRRRLGAVVQEVEKILLLFAISLLITIRLSRSESVRRQQQLFSRRLRQSILVCGFLNPRKCRI